LNDTTELRYGSKLFQEALSGKGAAVPEAGVESALLDGALQYFRENPKFPAQAAFPAIFGVVKTRFSSARDSCSTSLKS
jgi:hypothetical protein